MRTGRREERRRRERSGAGEHDVRASHNVTGERSLNEYILRASVIGALRLNNVRGFSTVNHNCRILLPFPFLAGKEM